ncbi:NGG1p interacting factor NIF3 [Methylomonas sp. AM2-LC]|uniref:NGG1p interacting factor NIF3 n=1 Tax=Methylomonas sp. AM2-LC TaxID=3153301 RepID=UPI003267F75F
MHYKIAFYLPATHCELVKNALFAVGAGQSELYDQCSWQILGEGQFRPLKGSRPFQGNPMQLESIPEYKIEMICAPHLIKIVIETLLKEHPYEQPAYEIYPILTLKDL